MTVFLNPQYCYVSPPPLLQVINGPREMLVSPQLLASGELVKDSVRGIFQTKEELDEYERLWHCHVYQPTWDQLQDKVR